MAEVYPELNTAIRRLMQKLQTIIEEGPTSRDPAAIRRIIRRFQPLVGPEVTEAYRQQFRSRYRYIVGEWGGSHRARSTVTGHTEPVAEVMRYLRPR